MTVYDTANQLAKEIRDSKEFKEYKQLKEKIMQNAEFKSKIDDFEKIRYEVQVLAVKGEQSDKEKMEKLQELYTILIQNKEIKEYFDLEVKFNVMIADVNKIIGESIKDVL